MANGSRGSRGGPRDSRGRRTRAVDARESRKTFLIVCEGTHTEPNYFNGFRVNAQVAIVNIVGTGRNTDSLVRYAVGLRDRAAGAYDETWVVFDRDSFTPAAVNSAFKIAKRESISVAFSNEAFEIWFLLHFHFFQQGMSRSVYRGRLSKLIGSKYEKNMEGMYELLLPNQADAIRNARKLLSGYAHYRPAHDNPSTTVHFLVEELNRHLVP